MWEALGSVGVVGLAGWVLAIYYRGQYRTAQKQDELDSGRADRNANALADVRTALTDRVARLDSENAALRETDARRSRQLADLARGNPELARAFMRGVLQEAAGAVASGPAAPVPGSSSPVPGPRAGTK